MTSYRRLRIPGATYFFTVCLQDRDSHRLIDRIDDLRWAYTRTVQELPVHCQCMVILPDHLHAIWTEPEESVRFSERWRRIKSRFSHCQSDRVEVTPSKKSKRERGIWQRRFWEHTIRDETELDACMRYCLNNPVKHGLVTEASHWPYSTFHKRRMGNIAHPTET
jgi:putative transposase